MSTLGTRIKAARSPRKLTQEALAAKIGVARATLASWEIGRASPGAQELARLSEVLGVTVDYLVKGPGESWPEEEKTSRGMVRVSDLSEAAVIRRGAASLRREIGRLSAELGRLMVGAGVAAALIEDTKPMYRLPEDVQVKTVIEFFSQAEQSGLTADQALMLLLDYLSTGLIRDDRALKHEAHMIAVMNERGRLHELEGRAQTARDVLHVLRDGSHRWDAYARGLAGGGGYGGYAEGAADAAEREVMELAEGGSRDG